MQHHLNQTRYKQIEPPLINSQQQPMVIMQMPSTSEPIHKSIETSPKDTNKLAIDVKIQTSNDADNLAKTPATSVPSNKIKTPMCLVNELVRANQVIFGAWKIIFFLKLEKKHFYGGDFFVC